jgi:hypothetical protein
MAVSAPRLPPPLLTIGSKPPLPPAWRFVPCLTPSAAPRSFSPAGADLWFLGWLLTGEHFQLSAPCDASDPSCFWVYGVAYGDVNEAATVISGEIG